MLRYIDRFLRAIEQDIFIDRVKLDGWRVRLADYTGPGAYTFRPGGEQVVNVGDVWGDVGTTAFFARTVRVPEEYGEDRAALLLQAGGEGLVRIGGRAYQGIDRNHRAVLLPGQASGGTEYEVEIEVFNPVQPPPDRLNDQKGFTVPDPGRLSEAALARVDRVAADLYFTLRAYRDALGALPATDPLREPMLHNLADAVAKLETGPRTEDYITGVLAELRARMERIGGRLDGTLVMVGQSHIDVAWLWPLKETMRKALRTFSTMTHLLAEYPDFLYTQSQPQLYAWVKEQEPELYERIKHYVQAGRWEIVGGMWVEPDLNLPTGESLVRQLLFGISFWQREFSVRPKVEWLPDTFGYCASLPQLLRQAGLDYFMTVKLYWNETNRFPYDLFWWEGIDGTRILTYVNHGLNEPATPGNALDHWRHYKQKDVHPEAMYLYGHGDGGGGVTHEMLELIAREEKGLPGLPRVRKGTAHGFFERAAEAGKKLPTWQGELYLETHRGTYTSVARNKRFNRKAELLYRDAELWSAVAAQTAGAPYPAGELRQGWEKILLNQFHDIIPGSSVPEVYRDSDADYEFIFDVGEKVRTSALRQLTGRIRTQGPGRPVVAFNSLCWRRTDVVKVKRIAARDVKVVDEEGNELPGQCITTDEGTELWFVATLPPMGYRTFWLVPDAGQAGRTDRAAESRATEDGDSGGSAAGGRWETSRFVLELDGKGRIVRLFDKVEEREVIPAGSAANEFQLFHDRPSLYDAWNIDRRTLEHPAEKARFLGWEVRHTGPVCDVLRLRWSVGNSRIEQDVVLYTHTPRIDFDTWVDWQEDHRLLKVAFPVAVRAAHATYEIPFGALQRPTHSNTSWEQAQFEVCGHKWADLSEAGYGVSLLNDCKYGYDVKGNVLRLSLLRAPNWPSPAIDRGEHRFTYSLYPHAGTWIQSGTVREAYQLNVPVAVELGDEGRAEAASDKGQLPATHSFLAVEADHAVLDTVKAAEDGRGLILRFYEAAGGQSRVTVRLDRPAERVEECNILEEPMHAGEGDGGAGESVVLAADRLAFTFTMRPFEVKTLRVV